MANFVYTYAKAKLISGDIDLNTDDIRAALVMTNTTCDTEEDKQFISGVNGFTTLDELDGAGYARTALTGEAVNTDTVNNRGEFDATDLVFAATAAGTRQVAGMLIFKFVATDADHIPIAFIDDGCPYTPGGGTITYTWNAEGILQAT